MIQLDILDESRQKFSLIFNGQRVTIELWYNNTEDRWCFDLMLDGDPIISGRKIVTGVDLLAPFQLGLGVLFALSVNGSKPTRDALPLGLVKLYMATQSEIDAAVSS